MKSQKHFQAHQQQQKHQTSLHKSKNYILSQQTKQTKQQTSLFTNEQKYNKIQCSTKLFGFLSKRNKSLIKTSLKNTSNLFYKKEQYQIEKSSIKQFQEIQAIKYPLQKPSSIRKINLSISNQKNGKINIDNDQQIIQNSFINSAQETKSKVQSSMSKVKQNSFRQINSLKKRYQTKRGKITLIDLPKHYEQLNNNSLPYSDCLCISKQLAISQRRYYSSSSTPSKKRQKSKIILTLNKNYKSTENLKEIQENTHNNNIPKDNFSKQTKRQMKFLVMSNSVEQTNSAQPKIKNNHSKKLFFDFQ